MNPIDHYCDYKLTALSRATATRYALQLAHILSLIPLVPYSEEQVLAEFAEGGPFPGKWELSLLAMASRGVAGVVMGYERAAHRGGEYPVNSIYISELAVASEHQRKGLGRYLLSQFLQRAKTRGFRCLSGPVIFSVQTNAASWNSHVQRLYASFGFVEIGRKTYSNRTDLILATEA